MHPGVKRWAEVTATCLALRRAGLRREDPQAPRDEIERRLRAELLTAVERRTDGFRRHG